MLISPIITGFICNQKNESRAEDKNGKCYFITTKNPPTCFIPFQLIPLIRRCNGKFHPSACSIT